MPLQVKADGQEFDSILKLLGLGGMPAAASDTGGASPEPPPIDPSIAGAPDPAATPDAQPSSASVIPSTHDTAQPPTKLLRLQQALGAATPAQVPPPIDPAIAGSPEESPTQASTPQSGIMGLNLQVPGQGNAMPPADLAQSMVPSGAPQKATFATNHPTLAKVLGLGLGFVQDAGPGVGSRTFGEGFSTAAAQPALRAQRDIENQKAQADIAHAKATTGQLTDTTTVRDPYGNVYQIPKGQLGKFVQTNTTETGKDTRSQAGLDSKESIANQKNAIALRAKGLKPDPANPNGPPVALSRDEMSENEQATLDLKQSQQDAASAKADLDRQKNDPNSAAYKAAMGRLQVAQKNAQTAAGKLGLAKDTFNANYFGTGPDGQALPGVPLTDDGTPEGVRVANITKPTNATRSKAEQATVIKQQGEDILKQIDANPNIYGAVAGRWNEFNAGKFGNASQEVRDAYTSLKSFAALQPALHGARGVGMMKEFEDAVGNMGNDPEGLKGSINSLLRTSTAFQKAGTMKTAPGNNSHPAATHVYDPTTGVISPVAPAKK